MTAHAMAGDAERSLSAGMNDHVTKPIDPDQLLTTLQKWISPHRDRGHVQEEAIGIHQLSPEDSDPTVDDFDFDGLLELAEELDTH